MMELYGKVTKKTVRKSLDGSELRPTLPFMAASQPKIFLGQWNEVDSRLSDIGNQDQTMMTSGYLPQLLNVKRGKDSISHNTDIGPNFEPEFLFPKLKISNHNSSCSCTVSSSNTSTSNSSPSTSGNNSDSEKNITDRKKMIFFCPDINIISL